VRQERELAPAAAPGGVVDQPGSARRRLVAATFRVLLAAVLLGGLGGQGLRAQLAVPAPVRAWSTVFVSITLQSLPFLLLGVALSAAVTVSLPVASQMLGHRHAMYPEASRELVHRRTVLAPSDELTDLGARQLLRRCRFLALGSQLRTRGLVKASARRLQRRPVQADPERAQLAQQLLVAQLLGVGPVRPVEAPRMVSARSRVSRSSVTQAMPSGTASTSSAAAMDPTTRPGAADTAAAAASSRRRTGDPARRPAGPRADRFFLPRPRDTGDVTRVRRWCDARVPQRARHQVHLECDVAPGHLTIVERRAPWRDDGSDWTTLPIARLRYTAADQTWTLFSRDRNLRFPAYDPIKPSRNVEDILTEIHRDPIHIFWG
jgi:Protein of unknown function (DUF3024)